MHAVPRVVRVGLVSLAVFGFAAEANGHGVGHVPSEAARNATLERRVDESIFKFAEPEKIAGQLVAPGITQSLGQLNFIQALGTPSASVNFSDGLSLDAKDGRIQLEPIGETEDNIATITGDSAAAFYRGVFPATDVAIVPSAAGLYVLVRRGSSVAPDQFDWSLPESLGTISTTDESVALGEEGKVGPIVSLDAAKDSKAELTNLRTGYSATREEAEKLSDGKAEYDLQLRPFNMSDSTTAISVGQGRIGLSTKSMEWVGFAIESPWAWQEPWINVPGQGPTKPSAGSGYRILLDSGEVIYSHGADTAASLSAPSGEAPASVPDLGPPYPFSWVDPVCSDAHRFTVLYGWKNSDNLTSALKNDIRDVTRKLTGRLWSEDVASGGVGTRLKVQCFSGEIAVWKFQASGANDFASIVSAAKAAGYNDQLSKYIIFWDSSVSNGGYLGQAGLAVDETKWLYNYNNTGTRPNSIAGYSISYAQTNRGYNWGISSGSNGAHVPLHEVLHTMGAVQLGAPGSNGLFHCWVTLDTMCYGEEGQSHALEQHCFNYMRIDCGKGKYFNPTPSTTNYLYDRWNIGQSENWYLTRP